MNIEDEDEDNENKDLTEMHLQAIRYKEDIKLNIPFTCRALFVPMIGRYEAQKQLTELCDLVMALLPTAHVGLEGLVYMLNKSIENEKDKISRATVYRLLRGVHRPKMTVESLIRIASSMGYKITFSLVPRKGFEEHVEKRRRNPLFKKTMYSP